MLCPGTLVASDGIGGALSSCAFKRVMFAQAAKTKGAASKQKQRTKLILKNIAFEATKKDLMSLCTPFGHVKELRLPRKFDGTHR